MTFAQDKERRKYTKDKEPKDLHERRKTKCRSVVVRVQSEKYRHSWYRKTLEDPFCTKDVSPEGYPPSVGVREGGIMSPFTAEDFQRSPRRQPYKSPYIVSVAAVEQSTCPALFLLFFESFFASGGVRREQVMFFLFFVLDY